MAKSVEQMGQEILDICAGQPSDDAHKAMMAAFAVHIGGLYFESGKSLRDAQEAIIDASGVISEAVKTHWGEIETTTQH